MPSPLIGPSYNLTSRPASVQRTINMMPVPLEPGNERTDWVLKDVPGLRVFSTTNNASFIIAWNNDVINSSSAATAGNSGAVSNYFPGLALALNLYGRVIGYTSETVIWSSGWAPSGGGSGATPIVTGLPNGVVEVSWPRGSPFSILHGLITITAVIDGNPAANGLEAVTGAGTIYNSYAWQPAP